LEFPAFLIEFPAAPCCIGEMCHQFLQKVKFSHFEPSAWNDVLCPFKFSLKSDKFLVLKRKMGVQPEAWVSTQGGGLSRNKKP